MRFSIKVHCYLGILFVFLFLLLLNVSLVSQPYENLAFVKGTYIKSGNFDVSRMRVYDQCTDGFGNIILCGVTTSTVTTQGVVQPTLNGETDGFIMKLTPDLKTVIWATYLGGDNSEYITGVEVNSSNEVFVTGGTNSSSFPGVSNQDQAKLQFGSINLFVTKLSSDATQLSFTRILGRTSFQILHGIEIAPQQDVFVCSATSTNPSLFDITSNAYQPSMSGSSDLTLTKLSSSGTTLYSTFVGGSGNDLTNSPNLVYANNKLYISGRTSSSNFPLATGKSPTPEGDCFVMVWNDGSTPTPQTTYVFGGAGDDMPLNMLYNQVTGKVMVCGVTTSGDMPYTTLLQNGNTTGAFVSSLHADLSGIDYLSIAGSGLRALSMAHRNNGEVFFTLGTMQSGASIPLTPTALQPNSTFSYPAAIASVSTTGALKYGSYSNSTFNNIAGNFERINIAVTEETSCGYKVIISGTAGTYPTSPGVYQENDIGGVGVGVAVFGKAKNDSLRVTAKQDCGVVGARVLETATPPCAPTGYVWSVPDGVLLFQQGDSCIVRFPRNGDFTLRCKVAYGADTNVVVKKIKVTTYPLITMSPTRAERCTKGESVPLSASGALRYEWRPSAGLSATTGSTVQANPQTTTMYYVRGYDANNCYTDDSVQVTVLSVTAKASTDTIVCKGTAVKLKASGGASITWSPSAGLSAVKGKEVTATPTQTTRYMVAVQDGNCSDTTYTTVHIANAPKVQLPPAPIICTGGSVNLDVVLLPTQDIDTMGVTYNWQSHTTLSSTTIKNPVAAPTTSTWYYVTVTNKFGCSTTDSVRVQEQTSLNLVLSNDTTICKGNSVLLKAQGGAEYEWIPITGLDNPRSATPRCNVTETTRYQVATRSGTCTDTAFITVTVQTDTAVKASTGTTICPSERTKLSVANAQPNYAYTWSSQQANDPELQSTSGAEVFATPSQSKTFYVQSTSLLGCTSTDSVRITVQNNLSVQAQGAATVCTGTQVTLTVANADSTTRYEWFNEQGQSIGTSDTLSTTPEKTSWYYVHAQRGTCTGRDSVQITVNNALSVEVQQDIAVCKGESFTLTISKPEQGATYTWKELNNQAQTQEGTTYTGTTSTSSTNTLSFEVHGIRSGCEGKDTVQVRINALPILTTQDVEVCVGSLATLTSTSSDSLQAQDWKDAQGTVLSRDNTLQVRASAEATYTYTATNQNGCTSSVTARVRTTPKVQLSTRVDARAGGSKNEREVEERFTIPFYVQSTENYNKQVQVTVRTEAEAFEIAGTTLETQNNTRYHVQTFTLPSVTQGETKVGEWNVRALLTQVRVPRFSITLHFAENDDCRIATASEDSLTITPECGNVFRQIVLIENMLTIAPNPVGEELHITSDEEMQSRDLHNALGEKVLTTHLGCKDCTLSTKELSNGVYQATVHFAGGTRTRMVVISK